MLGAAQSVSALYFQHKIAGCHVTAGWSRPNSVRIAEIPLNISLLEQKLVTATNTVAFNVYSVLHSKCLECKTGNIGQCYLFNLKAVRV